MDAAVTPLLRTLAATDDSATLIRTISLSGFGLRDAADGAVIALSGDGPQFAGRVLGGMADAELTSLAANNEGRHRQRITITDRDADAAGMVCGGAAHFLFTPVADLPESLATHLAQAAPLALVARADGTGADLLVTRKAIDGSLGSAALDEALATLAREELQAGSTSNTVHTVDEVEYLISAVVPATRLLIVGSGPMADAIAAQGELLGWTCAIDEAVDGGLAFLSEAGPADALAILSHDADVDVPLLDAALRSDIGYIGGMGSRGTQSRRRTSLTSMNWTEAELERIHGPIGLDLGSRTPSETAVAIAAEFLANRSGRAPGKLTDAAGPING